VPYLYADLPPLYAHVRREFLFDLQAHHGEHERCYVVGLTSIRARAIGLHIVTERGAMFAGLPLHAIALRPDAERLPLPALELWDCFSYYPAVAQIAFLRGCRANARCGDGVWRRGTYFATIDWSGGDAPIDISLAELPHERKSAHLLTLDCGALAALPNNRIEWIEGSFVTCPLDLEHAGHPGYRVSTQTWSVEVDWRSEHSDAYYYATTADVGALDTDDA